MMNEVDLSMRALDLYGVKNKTKAQIDNDKLFYLYYNKLLNLCLNRFEWINLPFSIDERFLEMTLCFQGRGVGFKNIKNDQLMFTQVVQMSELNVYFNPVYYEAYGVGGFNQQLDIDTGVICYNNYSRVGDIDLLIEYARRLADIQRTIDVHVTGHKIPSIWVAPKNKLLTLKNIFKKIVSNEQIIYADENLYASGTSLGVIGNPTEYIIDKLRIEKKQLWNEAMLMLGIDNANQDKKERLVSTEVESNNGQIEQMRYIGLNARREFCKRFNLMFDMDIWVRYRTNQDKTMSEEDITNDDNIEESEEEFNKEKEVVKEEREVIKNE